MRERLKSQGSIGLRERFEDAFGADIFGAQNGPVKRAKNDVNNSWPPTTIWWAGPPPSLQSIAQISLLPPRDYLLFFDRYWLRSFDASQSCRRAHGRRRNFEQ